MKEFLSEIFKTEAKTIWFYVGKETETDIFEHTTSVVLQTPIAIKALVTDLNYEKSVWKMPGVEADKAKEIIIEKRNENLLKLSQRIDIDSEAYIGWRKNEKLQYKIEGDYIRAYLYLAKFE